MSKVRKSIVFVDLSSSTAIFEVIGDEHAASLVRRITKDIAAHLEQCGGTVLKFLGDGVMAIFEGPDFAVNACMHLNDVLVDTEEAVPQKLLGIDRISVRVGVDYGTLVEVDNDAYGDIVNVASRILSLAKPGELMMTSAVYEQLGHILQQQCRRLGRVHIRGKTHPQVIYGLVLAPTEEPEPSTKFNQETVIASVKRVNWNDSSVTSITLEYAGQRHRFSTEQMPIVIGRSLECDVVVSDASVSRTHVRLDWFAGQFYLSDISINGTMVQYGGTQVGEPYPMSMRRQRCTLVRSGYIILGLLDRQMLSDSNKEHFPPCVRFDVAEKGISEIKL